MNPIELTDTARADNAEPDLLISVHADSHADNRVCGIQCYRLLGDHQAHTIGSAICEAYGRGGYYVDKGGTVRARRAPVVIARDKPGHWTQRAHYVLNKYNRQSALLVECGFASNDKDRQWLLSTEGKDALVDSMMIGVKYALDYFGEPTIMDVWDS